VVPPTVVDSGASKTLGRYIAALDNVLPAECGCEGTVAAALLAVTLALVVSLREEYWCEGTVVVAAPLAVTLALVVLLLEAGGCERTAAAPLVLTLALVVSLREEH